MFEEKELFIDFGEEKIDDIEGNFIFWKHILYNSYLLWIIWKRKISVEDFEIEIKIMQMISNLHVKI